MIQTNSIRHQARYGFMMFIVHHSYPQFFQVTKDTSTEMSSNFKAFKFYKFNLLSKYTHGETANLSRFILNWICSIFTHHFLAYCTKPIDTLTAQWPTSVNRASSQQSTTLNDAIVSKHWFLSNYYQTSIKTWHHLDDIKQDYIMYQPTNI